MDSNPEFQNSNRPDPGNGEVVQRVPIRSIVRLHWNPGKLEKPQVADLDQLDSIGRAAEAIRFGVQRTEYWMSPNGVLREWLRWNLAVGLMLGIPALFIVPVVTSLLGAFATWTALLVQIGRNLIVFPLLAVVFIALLSGFILLMRMLLLGRR